MDIKRLEFIKKAKEKHGDRYDYSKVHYINAKTKILITCKIHGDFNQTPCNHLSNYNFQKFESKLNFLIKHNHKRKNHNLLIKLKIYKHLNL